MFYQIRYRAMSLLRASKGALLPTIIALTGAYFGLYAIWGPKGLQVLAERGDVLAIAESERGLLIEEHEALERRVRLLDGAAIDRDLLEEEARRLLNYAHPDEVIVLIPPRVQASVGDPVDETTKN